MAFHRILDRRNVDRAADQLLKGEIQSGGLPAAGRPCQIYDAVGILQHTLEFLVIFLIHAELAGVDDRGAGVEIPQYHLSPNMDGTTEVRRFISTPSTRVLKWPILRAAFFRDIQVRQDFDPGDQGRMESPVRLQIRQQHPVDTQADPGFGLHRLDMDIARADVVAVQEQGTEQLNNRGLVPFFDFPDGLRHIGRGSAATAEAARLASISE